MIRTLGNDIFVELLMIIDIRLSKNKGYYWNNPASQKIVGTDGPGYSVVTSLKWFSLLLLDKVVCNYIFN